MAAAGLVGVLAAGGGLFFARHAGAGLGIITVPGARPDGARAHAGTDAGAATASATGAIARSTTPRRFASAMGFVSDRILGYVDANEEQRGAIEDILDRSVAETFTLVGERGDVHEQLAALLSEPRGGSRSPGGPAHPADRRSQMRSRCSSPPPSRRSPRC